VSTLEAISGQGFVVTPGRYVGAAEAEDVPFEPRFAELKAQDKDFATLAASHFTSSVQTLKPLRVLAPKTVLMATSAASRPRAIRMRPMRG